MDIHCWLDDTADREPPDEQQHNYPEHIQTHAADIDEDPAPRRHRRKRKRVSSDSSSPEHSRHERAKEIRDAHGTEHLRDAAICATRHRSRDRSRSDESPPQKKQHKSYDRRPRHKTKANRYEPQKRHEREHTSRGKPVLKQRKSHRSADGGRSAGVVLSFQLKNGPKNNRLTLKPDAAAGLFRHGRASAQVPPGGAGLPDVVFNEMRFLQRPKDHQDKAPARADNEAVTKKDRQQRREEEISAYFTADRGPTGHGRPASRKSRGSAHGERHQQPRRRSSARPPPVDLPEKPFLGFASKGQHATTQEPITNSHYTWSESEAPFEAEPVPPHPQKRALEPKAIIQSTEAIDTRAPRIRVPRRSFTKTSPPSVPHRMPSEPPIHVSFSADGEVLPRESSMFHTSDILRVHRGILEDTAKENQEPASSTPTSRLLRKAFEAVNRPAHEQPTFDTQPRKKRQKPTSAINPVLLPGLRERRLKAASIPQPTRPRVISSSTARNPQPVEVYDEMLDEPESKQEYARPLHIYANAQQAEALAYSPMVEPAILVHEQDDERSCEPGEFYDDAAPLAVPSQLMSDLYVQPQTGFRPLSARFGTDDYASTARGEDFAGFWRPNRLY